MRTLIFVDNCFDLILRSPAKQGVSKDRPQARIRSETSLF